MNYRLLCENGAGRTLPHRCRGKEFHNSNSIALGDFFIYHYRYVVS